MEDETNKFKPNKSKECQATCRMGHGGCSVKDVVWRMGHGGCGVENVVWRMWCGGCSV